MGINAVNENYEPINAGCSVNDDAKTSTLRIPSKTKENYANEETGKTDELSISIEGLKIAEDESSILKMQSASISGDIEAFTKAARERAGQLAPTNWDRVVDPKGIMKGAAYVEAVVKQYQEMENHIRNYYNDRHQENLKFDEPAVHIWAKYMMKGSEYYKGGMPRSEREISYKQELAILQGGSLSLNDSYALKYYCGARNIKQIDEQANIAAREKMDLLIADYKKANGITD